MQVITWNDSTENDGVAIYLFDDTKEIVREGDKTTINDGNGNPELIISDVNSSNSNVYQNAIEPDDYFGWKYSYNETDGWQAIEGWVDPRIELEEENLEG
tara:strand:+ start:1443 stop:1742 length:300 start_codon:yes stop_codon:yes gene_type:complete